MLAFPLLLFMLASLALAGAPSQSNARTLVSQTHTTQQPDVYEAIHQREAILAETLDTKDWARVGESVTQDVVYDSRPLGPAYGGLSVGLADFVRAAQAAFGDADVAHHVSNAIIRPNADATQANVTTYIVYSRWDPEALYDASRTYRIYERCDDLFVLDGGSWKLKYSLVTNLAPKVENPFFN